MSVAHFIARRILRSDDKDRTDRLSRPIVGIAVLGVVIGMAVMIVTVGITTGFQREVRTKVTGAGGHLQITSLAQTDPKETPRIAIDQPFYPSLDTVPGVAHIQVYATRPGIIETGEEIEGVVLKGVGKDHDWSFLARHLVAGEVPAIGDTTRPIDLLISNYLGERLRIGVDDTITVYLIKEHDDIRPRKYRVSGLYETGLEQLDHQLVFLDIQHLQRFAQWGLKAELMVYDTVSSDGIGLEALAYGGDHIYSFEWPGTDLHGKGPHWIRAAGDTTITMVLSDADGTIPDTAWVHIKQGEIRADWVWATRDHVTIERGGSGGSHTKYCGGFEVELDDFDDLMAMDDLIYREHLDVGLRSLSVRDRFPEIFAWLELLDTNVIVIIVLMIIVAIINMTSALLIIILERTPMIGVMKSIGATNGVIRRIFLIDAAYILGVGIILGDLLGIGLCLLQQQFDLVRLPIQSYYVDSVPVALDPAPILLLNIGTLVVCVLALVLPSLLVARIAPAKAIKFD
ncbi:MAG: ABC transporter permease [Flavobacteriales bacterium]|nr:ABC transporter permease [Flavobacteriales bacterium]